MARYVAPNAPHNSSEEFIAVPGYMGSYGGVGEITTGQKAAALYGAAALAGFLIWKAMKKKKKK